MKYRPEDNWDTKIAFENLPHFKIGTREFGDILHGITIGADAMLDVLKRGGQYVNNNPPKPGAFALVRKLKKGERGWMVFIPDDTEDERIIYKTGWVCATEHGFDYIHPASKVIESGYFCPICGLKTPSDAPIGYEYCHKDERGISY